MKKFLTLSVLTALTLPAMAQGDLLEGKSVYVLGDPLTWTNANGDYTFSIENNDHDLTKLTKTPRNTDNIWIFPEGQNGGGFMNKGDDFDYEAENKAIGIQGFYIDMESEQEVSSVYTTWEGAFATAYNIYFTSDEPNKASLPEAACEVTGMNGTEQTVNLESNNKGRYLVFQATDATNWGWGVKIRSISAYGDTESVTSLAVSEVSVPANSSTTVTVSALNVIGEIMDINKISDLTLVCSDPDAVEISVDGQDDGTFSVEGKIVGTYILTASATYNGEEVTGDAVIYVTYDWKNETNIASDKPVTYRWKEDGDDTENTGDKVTDLDNETFYQYNGEWGGGDSWIVIDLGDTNNYVVDAVEVYFSDNEVNANTGNNTFKLCFGTSESELPTDDAVWKPGEDWIVTSELNKIQGAYVTYILPQEERSAVRYVAYIDANNPKGKPMIGQIYVAGTEMKDAPEAAKVTVSANLDYIATGETVGLSSAVIDQYDAVMSDAEVIYYVEGEALQANEDGSYTFTPEVVGVYNVIAKSGEIESEPVAVHVIADSANDITKEELEILYEAAKGETGIENPFKTETQWTEEELGSSLVITFDSPVDLDLLKLRWEAACPSDYTVSVTRQNLDARSEFESEPEVLLNVAGRGFVGGVNPVDRLYNDGAADGSTILNGSNALCGADLKSIKSIIITPVAKDHGYNLRLLGIDALGTQAFIDDTTGVEDLNKNLSDIVTVYNLQGVAVRSNVNCADALQNLPAGIYIVGGKKYIKR